MAVLAKSLVGLRAAFDAAFPNRERFTDGWISDESHTGHVSGHNPDDTPGSLSEYSDPDSVAEVRAIDVDADLRAAGVTMGHVVAAILATPADRDRLRYIIFNRTIWSRSNGWRASAYSGPSPHTGHAHFSGDPAADESTAPWTSVLSIGDDMQITDRVPSAGTPDVPNRNLDQVLGDVWRGVHVGIPAALAELGKVDDPIKVELTPADRDAIVAQVVAQLVAELRRPLRLELNGRAEPESP